jgi:hypothetical protein
VIATVVLAPTIAVLRIGTATTIVRSEAETGVRSDRMCVRTTRNVSQSPVVTTTPVVIAGHGVSVPVGIPVSVRRCDVMIGVTPAGLVRKGRSHMVSISSRRREPAEKKRMARSFGFRMMTKKNNYRIISIY